MGVRKRFTEAVAAHRVALGGLEAARGLAESADRLAAVSRHRDLITRLAHAGTVITPGWLGHALTRANVEAPLGDASADAPLAVRLGECVAAEDVSFPVVANLLGTGHLVITGDENRTPVADIVTCVLLRLLAARPTQSLSVMLVDADASGVFDRLSPLRSTDLTPPPATTPDEIAAVADQIDAHLDHARRKEGTAADLPERLLVATGLSSPAGMTLRHELARHAATAAAARLHFVMTERVAGPPIDRATHVDTDGETTRVAGVPLPVAVDPTPDDEFVTRLTDRLSEAAAQWMI